MVNNIIIILIAAILYFSSSGVRSQPCVCLQEIESLRNLSNPMSMEHAGDGSNRMYVSEETGTTWILEPDGTRPPTPFLNISGTNFSTNVHPAFSKLVFHPDFVNNGKVYICYQAEVGEEFTRMRLSEMTVFPGNPEQVDVSTERILLQFPQRSQTIGSLLFGDDDYLYAIYGDTWGGDPFEPQNKSTFYGALARINVDSRTGDLEYGIPPDNPFLDDPDALPELYAYGFRQPYGFTKDLGDRDTGAGKSRIFIGDVGASAWEELNLLEAGGNYGWAAREGPDCYDPILCDNIGPEVFPVVSYNHTVGQCIISGYWYRGCMNPDLTGWFFFADYMTHKLFRMMENYEWAEISTCAVCPEGMTNEYEKFLISFAEDEEGELYIMATELASFPLHPLGAVYKIVDPNNQQPTCPPGNA